MATLDFTPLFRSSIGFDQVPSLLSHALQREEGGFPPYNIEKVGEDQYRIVMAVAGFGKDDVEIVQEQNRLSVKGKVKEPSTKTYLQSLRAPSSAISTSPIMSRSPMPPWARDSW
jgi:molecular chaperone IbpA